MNKISNNTNIAPLITIVTPSYNQGVFLEETIKSVLNQEYPNIEYIIIDGGSTDNSIDIIKKYEKRLSYWESNKDKGQTDAINKGMRISTGEIFAWQNSDDKYCEGTFEFVSDIFIKNPHIDILFGGWNFIDENGLVLSTRKLIHFSLRKLRAGSAIPPQPAVFFRRSSIEKVGGLNESKNQVMDYDLYVKIVTKDNVFITDKTLGEFRIHKASKTISAKKEQSKELKETRNELLAGNTGLFEKLFWSYSDTIGFAKDYIHNKLNIFSISDFIKVYLQKTFK